MKPEIIPQKMVDLENEIRKAMADHKEGYQIIVIRKRSTGMRALTERLFHTIDIKPEETDQQNEPDQSTK